MTPRKRDYFFGAIALALIVLGSSDVLAEVKTFTWTPPAMRVDGSPLAIDELDRYELECNGAAVTSFAGDTASGTFDFLAGDYTCALFAVDVDGLRSDMSNTVFFTVTSPPSPPTLFSVD